MYTVSIGRIFTLTGTILVLDVLCNLKLNLKKLYPGNSPVFFSDYIETIGLNLFHISDGYIAANMCYHTVSGLASILVHLPEPPRLRVSDPHFNNL